MSDAEREQAIEAIIDRARAVRQALRVEVKPMSVYVYLIKHERPEVEA